MISKIVIFQIECLYKIFENLGIRNQLSFQLQLEEIEPSFEEMDLFNPNLLDRLTTLPRNPNLIVRPLNSNDYEKGTS